MDHPDRADLVDAARRDLAVGRWPAMLKKLFLSALVLLSCLLLVETIVRGTWPVDQAPALAWDAENQLLIHSPNQIGYRFPDRNPAHPVLYTINHEGWNNVLDFDRSRDYSRHLAILVGDSFVEALQVAPSEAISARLQSQLGDTWRVYGMGISGAPLSQYLQMARAAERKYHPDIIIVVLVHNDFIESYAPPSNHVYASFWQTDGVRMIPPAVYHPSLAAPIMASSWATGRLAFSLVRPNVAHKQRWEMGVDIERVTADADDTERITDYLFAQFAQMKSTLLFVMDGPRDAIEAGRLPHASPVFALNVMARERAAAHGLRFVDLSPVFAHDFYDHQRPFSFPSDYHWNARTHDLVARTILPLVIHQ